MILLCGNLKSNFTRLGSILIQPARSIHSKEFQLIGRAATLVARHVVEQGAARQEKILLLAAVEGRAGLGRHSTHCNSLNWPFVLGYSRLCSRHRVFHLGRLLSHRLLWLSGAVGDHPTSWSLCLHRLVRERRPHWVDLASWLLQMAAWLGVPYRVLWLLVALRP